MEVERESALGVVARFPGSGGGRTLLFDGHTDVVPPGDIGAWTGDPFIPRTVQRDGRDAIVARGACDMKATSSGSHFWLRPRSRPYSCSSASEVTRPGRSTTATPTTSGPDFAYLRDQSAGRELLYVSALRHFGLSEPDIEERARRYEHVQRERDARRAAERDVADATTGMKDEMESTITTLEENP